MEKISSIITSEYHWRQFLNAKTTGGSMSRSEINALKAYVENRKYVECTDAYLNGKGFPYPVVSIINKQFSGKKRTVFLYPEKENLFLKFIAFHMTRYDAVFPSNLCSFRKKVTVKTAIKKLANVKGIDSKFSYKVDVSNYFNSVDVNRLLPMLENVLSDDPVLYRFLSLLLKNPYAVKDGKVFKIQKGIMAGVPISSFVANLYLIDVDKWFLANGISYIRYSDDIIIFADTENELKLYSEKLRQMLHEHGLEINRDKEVYASVGERWEFLGFSYQGGVIDISSSSLDKMKKKLKRKARALYRWKLKKGTTDERAIKAYIRCFNQKLYGGDTDDMTWSYWYFPVITTDKSLRIIDRYMQDCIRYIATGNYSKKRYELSYEQIKEYGFKSLVNEYYKGKKH